VAEFESHSDNTVLSPAVTAGSAKTTEPGSGSHAIAAHPHKGANNVPDYYAAALDDAERLLKYAAECGIDVDDDTRSSILQARSTVGAGWDEKTAAGLLAALTKLASRLKPVTAESLRSFSTKPTVRRYWIVSICLGVLIVPFSVASFVSSAISQSITADVVTANDLVRQLNADIGSSASQVPANTPPPGSGIGGGANSLAPGVSPAEVITKLQTLASAIRAIYDRADQLNTIIFPRIIDSHPSRPGAQSYYEIQVPLAQAQLNTTTPEWIRKYQDARSFAQEVVGEVSVLYGSITYCILPVLYALLGTCAYLLRSFGQEMSNRTFVPSHSDSPRFLIAAIGGAVVGLFNNFTIGQTPSISPLAIAFLVGYAVDVFFSFLEGLTVAFARSKTSKPA
jgi:hypothetical protein